MAASNPDIRDATPLDEFAAPQKLAFLPVYALPSYSLTELTHHLAAAQKPSVLPNPCIGTRIVFRHVHANSRYGSDSNGNGVDRLSSEPRFIVKDLGSVVLGGGSPAAPLTSLDEVDDYVIPDELVDEAKHGIRNNDDGNKTLADVRYVTGDFISCAILPPLANGCVAPESSARSGRGSGIGEAPASRMPPPPPVPSVSRLMSSHYGKKRREDTGFGVPSGEWRRGDAVPDNGAWIRDGGRSGGGVGRRDRGWQRDGRGDRDDRW
ncbi:hypothetical protein SEUCBS139899_009210 [Sporothrix eucalyptigena]|uniref:Sin3-associated polypeptide Sap18 n=1 Tax=Sporothrix eucalyptigena TaxID=1812306 RepID=A0ABP0C1L2_9PEZI